MVSKTALNFIENIKNPNKIWDLGKKADKGEFFSRHGLDENKKLVSIFPGSRVYELNTLMKTFIKSAEALKKQNPDIQFLVSQAPNLSNEVYNKFLCKTDFKVVKGENHAMLSVSDALILASGTVSLEASLYQTPMIIAYRGPLLLYLIYLVVRCLDKVSLPNIIANKMIVPELIQAKLSVENIVNNIEKILYDDSYRENFIKELGIVNSLLECKNSPYEVALELKSALS